HWHAENGAPERRDLGMLVLRIHSDVSLLDGSRENGAAGDGASAGRPREESLEGFPLPGTPAVVSHHVNEAAVEPEDGTLFGFAQPHRARSDRVERRLDIGRRA